MSVICLLAFNLVLFVTDSKDLATCLHLVSYRGTRAVSLFHLPGAPAKKSL